MIKLIGFKVVHIQEDHFLSCCAPPYSDNRSTDTSSRFSESTSCTTCHTILSSKNSQIYKIGIPSKRREPHGPLAVFTDRSWAFKFIRKTLANLHFELKTFKCEYIKSADNAIWIGRKDYPDRFVGKDYCPDGTDFADEVTLLEEVYE